MHPSLERAAESLIDATEEVSDPVAQYREIKELEVLLDRQLKQRKANITKTLKVGRSWKKVGELLGVTGSRAEQISRAAR